MTAPLLNVDHATMHVAEVLMEQGYNAEDAYQAAARIVYKCAIACTSTVSASPRSY